MNIFDLQPTFKYPQLSAGFDKYTIVSIEQKIPPVIIQEIYELGRIQVFGYNELPGTTTLNMWLRNKETNASVLYSFEGYNCRKNIDNISLLDITGDDFSSSPMKCTYDKTDTYKLCGISIDNDSGVS